MKEMTRTANRTATINHGKNEHSAQQIQNENTVRHNPYCVLVKYDKNDETMQNNAITQRRGINVLKIHYGELEAENYIFNPDAFFNNTYEDEWITDPFSVQMIKDIDGSDVKGARAIDSPFLGLIPTERLSGGVKTLILMNNDSEHIFNASACGDNCAKWILEIGKKKELLIRLGYLMDFGKQPFDIEVENLGLKVHNMKELIETVLDNELL